LALWKGRNWENNDSEINFLGRCLNKTINVHFTGYCEQDLLLLSGDLMSRLYRDLEQLDKKAQKVIQDNWPDEVLAEYHARDEFADVEDYLVKDGPVCGYLFRCLDCKKYHLWVDAD